MMVSTNSEPEPRTVQDITHSSARYSPIQYTTAPCWGGRLTLLSHEKHTSSTPGIPERAGPGKLPKLLKVGGQCISFRLKSGLNSCKISVVPASIDPPIWRLGNNESGVLRLWSARRFSTAPGRRWRSAGMPCGAGWGASGQQACAPRPRVAKGASSLSPQRSRN